MNEVDAQQEAQRGWIRAALNELGMDLTAFARAAGLTPSTLTRFMNSDVGHVLSTRTWAKLVAVKRGYQGKMSDFDAIPADLGAEGTPAEEYGGEFVDDPDELAWLALWRAMPDREREIMLRMARANIQTKRRA